MSKTVNMTILPALSIAYVAGLVIMRASDPAAGWTDAQTLWLNGGALVLAVVFVSQILASVVQRVPESCRLAAIASVLLMVAALVGLRGEGSAFNHHAGIGSAFASVTDDGEAAVAREWDGHFRTHAAINGNPVEVLVDTGASLVLLTYEDAVIAGIDIDALQFSTPILTANGRGYVATTMLPEVSVGGVTAKNIKGAIAQPGQLHASLLGMSFLGAIEEAVIRKDRLILRN